MNICEYERIAADPDLVEKIRFNVFYERGTSQDPHFLAVWALVPEEEKQECAKIGLQAVYALVDDFTTPGCDCEYCASGGEDGHGKPIMCQRRWEALPLTLRMEITDSMDG